MGEEDGDSFDQTPGDAADPAEKVCEHCGAVIDTSDWYPVVNERDANGSLVLYHFCCEDCRDAWSARNGD